ncbi:hypothetical protein AR687_01315 [Flavobacteriaceae bacterium CRH]|jgi:rare lipoprotein A|nr:hypothetical protein AR687_01315 [Flavobacteriaceae bacterium CRH]
MKKVLLYIIFLISLKTSAQQNPEFKDQDKNQDIECSFKLYKENAHASYYNNRFNGRRTASGKKFDNNKLTAAHKKLPFGTKLKVTNPKNNKYVIVEVIDRGPFVNGREIDLTEKAFMDIASNKGSGVINVQIEIVVN